MFLYASVNKHTFSKKIHYKEREETTATDGEISGKVENKEDVENI